MPTLNLGHNKMGGDTDRFQAARSATNERAKARQKRQNERALLESAAEVAKFNEEGHTIANTAFDASLTLETADTYEDKENESGDVNTENGVLSHVASKLEEFISVDRSSAKRSKKEMTESSIQTVRIHVFAAKRRII